jgi:dipeptidyl aminopeptidase/acylaminoacyl peptidase
VKPADIGALIEAGDPRVSPDGHWVTFSVVTIDVEANTYRSRIWLSPTDGSAEPRPLTAGDDRDGRARWSPDGGRLAFVSHRGDKGSTLHVLPTAGPGEVTTIATWPEEIDDVAWSPDGRTIAFGGRARDEDRYGKEADKDRPARRIDRITYRLDSVGWTIDRHRHLFTVPADGSSKPLPVTTGQFEDSGLAWSPDGTHLALAAGRHEEWDIDWAVDLYRVAADGSGEPERLTSSGAAHSRPSWSPDGTRLAYVWGDRRDLPRNGQVGVLDLDNAGQPGATGALLTADIDRHCAPYLAAAREPVWDGDALLFQVEDRGATHIYSVPVDGKGKPEVVVGGDITVTSFDKAGGVLAYAACSNESLTEVFVVGTDGESRQLTSFTPPFLARNRVAAPERFVASSADGTEVEAWIIKPLGAESGRRYPTLLNVHGGPFTQYSFRIFDEFQVQAEAGYAVLYTNPRGSSGFGEAWGRAIRGPKATPDPGTGWGGCDYDDVLAVVDAAVERFDFVDPDRLGILGGSYGGFMTSWVIGHTDRFKAAVSERAVNNMFTMSWTSDLGPVFDRSYQGVDYLTDPEELLRQSPITYVKDMQTPVLVLHSENDLRCPIEQGEQLFTALRLLGRDVEFVRFPGESHELSRAGAPKHRVERFEVILDYFGRKL